MNSIRQFLIVVLLTATLIVIIVGASYGYRSGVRQTQLFFDDRLADLAAVLAETPPGYYETVAGDNASAFQIWEAGELKASSSNAPEDYIVPLTPGYANVKIGGFQWRAFTKQVDGGERWVIVAESEDIRLALADSIILDSVLPTLLGLPILGALIWLIVGRGMRPLDELAKRLRAKQADDLSPVADLQPPLELTELVSSFNDLLQRLNASVERERQFAADAAHELCTPISVLKVQLHNMIEDAGTESPELKSLQDAVDRMDQSVEQVLMLNKMAPEQFSAILQPVDLHAIARTTIAGLYPQLKARQQKIELTGTQAHVRGDTFALQTLLSNLVGNASRYSGAGGLIKVSVTPRATDVLLVVEDSGPGIPAQHRKRVFERFYRGEHDSAVAGSGIGLAIVQNIAEIHHAEISLGESGFDSGLAVHVVFAASPSH